MKRISHIIFRGELLFGDIINQPLSEWSEKGRHLRAMEVKELVDVEIGFSELLGLQKAMARLPFHLKQAKAGSHFEEVLKALNLESVLPLAKHPQAETHDSVPAVVGSATQDGSQAQGQSRTIVTDEYHDGILWRKYGEKRIPTSNYTRNYYRCNAEDSNCPVRKRVQQIEYKNRSLYLVTYFGHHTCKHSPSSVAAPSTPPPSKKPRHESPTSGLTSDFQQEEQQPTNNSSEVEGTQEVIPTLQSDYTDDALVNCAAVPSPCLEDPSMSCAVSSGGGGPYSSDELLDFNGIDFSGSFDELQDFSGALLKDEEDLYASLSPLWNFGDDYQF